MAAGLIDPSHQLDDDTEAQRQARSCLRPCISQSAGFLLGSPSLTHSTHVLQAPASPGAVPGPADKEDVCCAHTLLWLDHREGDPRWASPHPAARSHASNHRSPDLRPALLHLQPAQPRRCPDGGCSGPASVVRFSIIRLPVGWAKGGHEPCLSTLLLGDTGVRGLLC